MKKLTLLTIMFSLPIYGAGEEGSGNTPESSSTNETNYQLVCTTNTDPDQLDNDEYCILVPISTDE